ncbi:MAG: SRPBCC domain-containing protein [Stagnimonas sp.]|nr:SRPBCC domain-containing protein [Stagnimonas sp.]
MFVIEKTLEIQAPAALVWEVITDLGKYPQWNPFLVECRTSFKPGDPIDLQVKLVGKPQPQREWVLEYVEGKRFAYRMKPVPGTLSSFRSHDVEALGPERTRYRSYFHLQGWLHHVVVALLGSRLQTGFAGMTAGIQQRAEALWKQRKA